MLLGIFISKNQTFNFVGFFFDQNVKKFIVRLIIYFSSIGIGFAIIKYITVEEQIFDQALFLLVCLASGIYSTSLAFKLMNYFA